MLIWSGLEGTVTDVVVPGDTIRSGDVVAHVDGNPVVGLHTEAPLYRDISRGMSGTDVLDVATELYHLGYLDVADIDSYAGTNLERAVREFNRRYGVVSSDLDLVSIVWLPSDKFKVVSVGVTLGAPSPSRGERFALGHTPLLEARVAPPEGSGEFADRDGASQFRIGGLNLAMGDDDLVDELLDLEKRYTVEDTRLTGGVVELAEPIRSWKVPPSAVIAAPDGSTCVVSSAGVPTAVTVVGGGPGEAELIGSVPDEIVGNPVGSGVGDGCDGS